ncbi:hypothetical protein [Streptantibioticus silvisoli]|jgi:hypothetical protein|uniref:Bulb-type lectin domain-containing protein n=1 Tax=Streptantibioticus silvisoli TaxID=2705255 RepID=A0ABT6VT02_9ACTN|nr:hypothetical protein [Streptantibioticus silvisoli]MDI5961174.1 hypothetical protein [Streptantibioticus silvisoli]
MLNSFKVRVGALVAGGVMVSGALLGMASGALAAAPGTAPGNTVAGYAKAMPNSDTIIRPRATICKNQAWTSGNGRAILRMQSDGNFVLYKDNRPVWQAPNSWSRGNCAVFQEDGNFVVYDSAGGAVWAAGTYHEGAYLAVQDDGNVVVYNSSRRPVWATNTGD